jgi:hypothetical protein
MHREGMLGDANLNNPHEVEVMRRSVAMLPANTGTGVLTREESLRLLDALRAALAAAPPDGGDQSTWRRR